MSKEKIAVLVRTAVLFLALVNQLLLVFGYTMLPITEEELNAFLTTLLTILSSLWVWWGENHLFKRQGGQNSVHTFQAPCRMFMIGILGGIIMRNYNKHPLRIFIGVGHGGSDPGAVNKTLGLTEAGINLTIALLMERDLKRHGVQVMLSRYTDEDDRLKEEIAECNAYTPDFAVEIHT